MNLSGHYAAGLLGFSVVPSDDGWWIRFPGMDDLGCRIVGSGPTWTVVGGPADGATIELGPDGGSLGGVIPIRRLDEPPKGTPGFGIPPPSYRVDAERDAAFERLWESASGPIPWDLPYPKHEFLTWLERREDLVFHGSNRSDIAVFRTRRESFEIDDVAGRGNLEAVYGTIRPFWAWYFAIVDRPRIRGSLRNGVARFLDENGDDHIRYSLSLASQDLVTRPFTDGSIYIFDRASFAPLPLYPGGPPSPEWACFEAVEPRARLDVTPDEYPLLDQIGGHDEAAMFEYAEAAEQLYEYVSEVVAIDPDLVVALREEPPAELVDRYVATGAEALPGTNRTVESGRLRVSGPAEYRRSLARRLTPAPGADPRS